MGVGLLPINSSPYTLLRLCELRVFLCNHNHRCLSPLSRHRLKIEKWAKAPPLIFVLLMRYSLIIKGIFNLKCIMYQAKKTRTLCRKSHIEYIGTVAKMRMVRSNLNHPLVQVFKSLIKRKPSSPSHFLRFSSRSWQHKSPKDHNSGITVDYSIQRVVRRYLRHERINALRSCM
jgi:hypothetical protein